MSLNLKSSGGGSVTVDVPSTASNYTATLPAATGTVMVSGNQPAFSAEAAVTQNISQATYTKVTLGTVNFDTNSNFTSSKFTPTVAGYYQINGTIRCGSTSALNSMFAAIYKNGSAYIGGASCAPGVGAITGQVTVSGIIYMNGTTDYLELYGYVNGSGTAQFLSSGAGLNSVFTGALMRAA